MKKIFHLMKAVKSKHLTFVMEKQVISYEIYSLVFFPIKHHVLWEATKFEKNLPLSVNQKFHKLNVQ